MGPATGRNGLRVARLRLRARRNASGRRAGRERRREGISAP